MTIKVPTYDASGADLLRAADVTDNLEQRLIASPEFGPEAQLESDKPMAQVIQPFAHELGQVYDLAQAVIDARKRVSAEGVMLDALGEVIGVPREPATYSTVTLTLTGTPATPIAAGKRARIPGTEIYWELLAAATIGGGGTVDAAARCTVIGAYEAGVDSITEIADLVTGWTSVTNAAAASTGDEIEADSTYRRRQKTSLSAGGTARPAAIRAALERLEFVTAAAVIENVTLVTDSKGIPGKSYRPVVYPTGLSSTQEELIVLTIWLVTPGGIYIDGSERYDVTSDQNSVQNIGFEYGTNREIYSVLDLTITGEYPSTGDADVEAALKVYDNDYSLGSEVIPDDIVPYVRSVVPGIKNVVLKLKFGSAPAPADIIPLSPGVDEVPYFDTNVTVNS